MNIVIACGAMPFGPATLETQSLGGSETAALMLAKELAKRGHQVKMFCNLPPKERLDHWPGGKAEDGVLYVRLEHYQGFVQQAQTDLTIIVRDPSLAAIASLTKKKVLWMHDVATKRGMQRAFEQMEWCIDEVWTVSEWHRQQVSEITGYPLSHIKALRNGIVPIKTLDVPRLSKQLIYAARPERGLDNLIMPGGIMDTLPDYNLLVCMYDHFPEHMRGYYEQVFARMKEMSNVTFLGPKPQSELRQIIRDSAAYIYPTQFLETSCILARECIEQQTPFISTKVGALAETLGDEGIFFEDWVAKYGEAKQGTPEWCQQFAAFAREALEDDLGLDIVRSGMGVRTDLYWDGVAAMVEAISEPKQATVYSRAWSLMQDGDVIAAKAWLEHTHEDPPETWSFAEGTLWHEIANNYPFLLNPSHPNYKSMHDYYEWVYQHKADREDSELVFRTDATNRRIEAIKEQIAKLPAGSRVAEFGCGPGHLLAALAVTFPEIEFFGIEISEAAVKVLNDGAKAAGIKNLSADWGDDEYMNGQWFHAFDAVICSEVLEHTIEPWSIITVIEMLLKSDGGKVILSTPTGPWEQSTIRQPGKWKERAHIWHLDGAALLAMVGHKTNVGLQLLPVGMDAYGRPVGNTLCVYDHKEGDEEARYLKPVEKALEHFPRQTCVACVIAMNNEATILRMLESIADNVQGVRVALGPSTDNTREIINQWAQVHPWIAVQIIDAPKIEPYKFGFDDARNLSTYGFDDTITDFDWFMWIDTDEYLSGNFSQFLRNSSITGYIIPQHHFTVEPRGGQTQIDRPARLLRTDAGYRCKGRIHEHFQIDDEVGRVWQLPNVDLGHVGYVNEDVRRSRFRRNWDFLEWDHKDPSGGTQRKLHYFLWFRDIVHRLRLAINARDMEGARKLAEEGLAYYNEHWQEMLTIGHALHMGLAYVSEIRNYLGQGTPVKIAVQFDDKQAMFEGRFENYDDIATLLRTALEPELKDRASRFW